MAEVRITFDDETEQVHEVPDIGAREIDATLKLWKQFAGGIILGMEDGEEVVVMPPSALQEFDEEGGEEL